MPSRNVQAAQLVADALNVFATETGRSFSARRRHLVVVDPQKMGQGLHVDVIAVSDAAEGVSRGGADHDLAVGVAISQRLDAAADAEQTEAAIDGLIDLAEQIADHLTGRDLAALDAAWLRTEHEPVVDRNRLYTQRTFVSQITVRYRL